MTQNNDMNAADMYASLASAQAAARHLIETGDTLRAQRDALVSACQSAATAYQSMFSVMPVAWQTIDDEICAALEGAK
jgi:hypothetical protein